MQVSRESLHATQRTFLSSGNSQGMRTGQKYFLPQSKNFNTKNVDVSLLSFARAIAQWRSRHPSGIENVDLLKNVYFSVAQLTEPAQQKLFLSQLGIFLV